VGPSLERVRDDRDRRARWFAYLIAGAVAAALIGPYLVIVLLGSGLLELMLQRRSRPSGGDRKALRAFVPASVSSGGIGALAWTALKVGALSFGGGFVIIPLMQSDAVHVYHWMTGA